MTADNSCFWSYREAPRCDTELGLYYIGWCTDEPPSVYKVRGWVMCRAHCNEVIEVWDAPYSAEIDRTIVFYKLHEADHV
jgi:hypothetical protein